MPHIKRLLKVFCPVKVLGNELMAEGNQNEQPPCITVKTNGGKRSTDLNQLDLRSIAITSIRKHFLLWWAYSKMDYVHAGFEQE